MFSPGKLLNFALCCICFPLSSVVQCKIHTAGSFSLYAKRVLYKTIYSDNETWPGSYTVSFKYKYPVYRGELTYMLIDLSCESSGRLDMHRKAQIFDVVEGKFRIMNCAKLNVFVEAYAFENQTQSLGNGGFEPKTYIMVHRYQSPKFRVRRVSKGQRQPGDNILHSQIRVGLKSGGNTFSMVDFELTLFWKFITFVELSIDSPGSIVHWKNKYEIEHNFAATVHDFIRNSFVANLTIYGYEDRDKPTNYKPIDMMEQT